MQCMHTHTQVHTQGCSCAYLLDENPPAKWALCFCTWQSAGGASLKQGLIFELKSAAVAMYHHLPAPSLSLSPLLSVFWCWRLACVCVSVWVCACLPECISSREAQRESGSHSARLKTKTRSAMHTRLNTAQRTYTHTHTCTNPPSHKNAHHIAPNPPERGSRYITMSLELFEWTVHYSEEWITLQLFKGE